MAPEAVQLKVIDVFGPDLTPELAEYVKGSVAAELGFRLTKDDLLFLHRAARAAAIHRAFGERGVGLPALGISISATDDVGKAARKLLSALRAIRKHAEAPITLGRENIADTFMSDDWDYDENDITFITD